MYCSKTCVNASASPLAICRSGMDDTTFGSRIEKTGNKPGPPMVSFCLVSARVITAPEFISEPVAGKVSTVPNGIPFCVGILFCKIAQGSSPLYKAADERNLVPSITEPPPTASKKVIFFAFITCNAFSSTANSGLAGMPPNSSIVYSLRAVLTWA